MRVMHFIFLFGISGTLWGQVPGTPKLVVGIVVDQMRYEYLYRFERKYGNDGFRRFLDKGFAVRNGHYNYMPTYTGPGHASVFCGTTPAVHGVIGNDWYDKVMKKSVNCVGDERYAPVGSDGNGDVSPSRMLASTISDELELATQRRAKVVGISLKDRGAVLPAGHTPDGAYWYDGASGRFITSTYYKQGLPTWLEKFNNLGLPDKYLNQEWKTVLPIEQYRESGPDDNSYETILKGKEKPVFPYNYKELRKLNGELGMISESPFGNDLLAELAKAAIDGESMGQDEWTDLLTISFSSPDGVGHDAGPNSIEVEDVYIRLDKNLEDLFKKLDQTVGVGLYSVFLTADHAVADVPSYLKDLRIPSDNFKMGPVESGVKEFLQPYFPGKNLIENISNGQIFLNQELFGGDPRSSGIDYLVATELIRNYLLKQDGVADVYTRQVLQNSDFNEGGVKGSARRGFHTKRSGDLAMVLEPGWLSGGDPQGTSHGSPYTYDTHVPILFYGFGVRSGSTVTYHTITDIAPTMSIIMKIKFPNACTGQPISELFESDRR